MANTIPGTYPAPDPLGVSAGQPLDSASVAPLFSSANWVRAHLGAREVVSQAFPFTDGASIYQDSKAAFAGGLVWRVPEVTRSRTTLDCRVYAGGPAGSEVRFRSATGADTATINVTGAAKWHSATLDYDPSGDGYDTITMDSHSDGVTPMTIESVALLAQRLSSPLAVGKDAADSFVAFDDGEYAVGEGLSSDGMARLRTDLGAVRDTPQVYVMHSAAASVDGLEGVLQSRPHVWAAPVWVASTQNHWDLDVHVRATGLVGVASQVVVSAGTRYIPPGRVEAVISVPSGAAEAWYSTTLRLVNNPGNRVVNGMPAGYETVVLTVWPVGTGWYASNKIGLDTTRMTTAAVNSVCIWGR